MAASNGIMMGVAAHKFERHQEGRGQPGYPLVRLLRQTTKGRTSESALLFRLTNFQTDGSIAIRGARNRRRIS